MKYGVSFIGTSLFVAGLATAANGCSNVDEFKPTGPSDGGGASDTSVTVPDGGDGDGREGDGRDGGPTTKGAVLVSLSQDTQDGKPEVSAYLESELYAAHLKSLIDERDGPCRVTVRAIVPPTDAGRGVPLAAVGTVVVRGGVLPPEGLTLLPRNTFDKPVTVGRNVWSGGDAVTFEASGGANRGFTGKVVLAPSDIQLRAPASLARDGGQNAVVVNRTEALALRWTEGGVGTVSAYLTSRDSARQRRTLIFCEFPARDGSGSISTKVLAYLDKSGDPGVGGSSFTVVADSHVDFVSGEWDVTLDLAGATHAADLQVY